MEIVIFNIYLTDYTPSKIQEKFYEWKDTKNNLVIVSMHYTSSDGVFSLLVQYNN